MSQSQATEKKFNLSKEDMRNVLKRLNSKQLSKYNYLQSSISKKYKIDTEYQKIFRDFYCVEGVKLDNFMEKFFLILEKEKNNSTVYFDNILKQIINISEQEINNDKDFYITPSLLCFLCSNIIHMINPNKPVWSDYALYHFNLDKLFLRYRDPNSCIRAYSYIYSALERKSKSEIEKNWFLDWRKLFDETYKSCSHFSDIKKLDLFFWKNRSISYIENFLFKEYYIKRLRVDIVLHMLREGLISYIECKYMNNDGIENHKLEEIKTFLLNENSKLNNYYEYNSTDYKVRYSKIEDSTLKKHISNQDWDLIDILTLIVILEGKNRVSTKIFDNLNNIYMDLRTYRNRWAHQKDFNDENINCICKLSLDLLDIFIKQHKNDLINHKCDELNRKHNDIKSFYNQHKNRNLH